MKNIAIKRIFTKWLEQIQYHYIQHKYALPIMTSQKTVDHILKTNCSVARYGDGDFDLMMKTGEEGYQKTDENLSAALKAVFENNSPNLLICIPYPMINTSKLKKGQFWRYWTFHKQKDVVLFIRSVVDKRYRFGDSFVSRPFSGYKTDKMAEWMFPQLKKLWDGKDVLFVEGERSCLGIGNDLFSNCNSIKRILCPAENAFSVYPQILESVRSHWNGELVIIALGPTATVLASDLSKQGIQALDMGHVDIQYEWFLKGRAFEAVEGKFTNESLNGTAATECFDKEYLSQIIDRVGC